MNYFHDVLIIGSGGSGLSLAIKLKKAGVKDVAILSKSNIMGSHTTAAKGGINASLSSVTEDSFLWHAHDTEASAKQMADHTRVEFMCKQAPQEIEFLEKQGVNFDKLENGVVAQRRYGGQKTHFGKGDFAYRACFVQDKTGFEIMKNLELSGLEHGVKNYEFFFAFNATRNEEGKVTSISALNLANGQFATFNFKIIVFATGGFSQNYHTNSSSTMLTGDGQVLALNLGAKLEDLEFVQFHPTGLYGKGILISEATRAEGAYLLNEKGERFLEKYSKDFMELAPRDLITRAIFEEGGGKKPAFLSLKHLPREVVLAKLAGTVETAKFFGGIDVFTQDIPVFPTAHYNMGGIKVDFNYKIEGLLNAFAIGECAGSRIHGANRLGCNSLLELFTSSTLACNKIIEELETHFTVANSNRKSENLELEKWRIGKSSFNFEELLEIKNKLGLLMEEKCGVIREEKKMLEALNEVVQIREILSCKFPLINSFIFSNPFVAYFEVMNLLILSEELIKAAIARKESRGAHLRSDFPNLDPSLGRA